MQKQSNTMMSNEQLQRIVRTIVMHDVSPQMKQQAVRKPVEACRGVLQTLEMNFGGNSYDRNVATQMILDEIMER